MTLENKCNVDTYSTIEVSEDFIEYARYITADICSTTEDISLTPNMGLNSYAYTLLLFVYTHQAR